MAAAGLGEPAAVHPLDEVAKHLLAYFEIVDNAVLERPNRLNVTGCPADHAFGFCPDSQNGTIEHVDRDDRGLPQDDALSAHIYERIRGAQIDCKVATDRNAWWCHGQPLVRLEGC